MTGEDSKTNRPLVFTVMPKISSVTLEKPHTNHILNSGNSSAPTNPFTPTSGTGRFKIFIKNFLTVILTIGLAVGCVTAGYYGWNWWKDKQPNESYAQQEETGPENKNVGQPAKTPSGTESEWIKKYFGSTTCINKSLCGTDADPDNDGLLNFEEKEKQTDPNNPDSDKDGLSDADEVHIFGSDPLNSKTSGQAKYTDSDFIKGGYNLKQQNTLLTEEELLDIGSKIKKFGLHQPSIKTLLGYLGKYGADPDSESVNGIDKTPAAKLERDTSRTNTIKKLGVALYKYFQAVGDYPEGSSFSEMLTKIKPYNSFSINTTDPINRRPFAYSYYSSLDNKSFTLSYFSETQNQLIKYGVEQAARDFRAENAEIVDEQRVSDLEDIRQALLIYSSAVANSSSDSYSFPSPDNLETALIPIYLKALPKDPKSDKLYEYKTDKEGKNFTIAANLDNPPAGTTRYICDKNGCLSD